MAIAFVIPDNQDLARFYALYKKFITGGIQHSINAPEQFHKPLDEKYQQLPQEIKDGIDKTDWLSVTLLADGDLTLSVSEDFTNHRSAQELVQSVKDLQEKIAQDVEFLSRGVKRIGIIIHYSRITLGSLLIGYSFLHSATFYQLTEWTLAITGAFVTVPSVLGILVFFFKKRFRQLLFSALKYF